jgi:hypothetical protein
MFRNAFIIEKKTLLHLVSTRRITVKFLPTPEMDSQTRIKAERETQEMISVKIKEYEELISI